MLYLQKKWIGVHPLDEMFCKMLCGHKGTRGLHLQGECSEEKGLAVLTWDQMINKGGK